MKWYFLIKIFICYIVIYWDRLLCINFLFFLGREIFFLGDYFEIVLLCDLLEGNVKGFGEK